MKVLIAVPCLQLPGGVANYYRTLRPHLDADKVYVEVGSRPGEERLVATLIRLATDFRAFRRMLRQGSFDLVHLNPSLVPNSIIRDGLLLLIARAQRKPVLVFFRGWDNACAERIRSRYRRLFRMVYGRAQAFIVLGTEFREALGALGIHAPILLETTVVDDEMVTGPAAGGTESGCSILYLSRLDTAKGLLLAIEAFARVRADWPTATLTIAGDGPERGAAEALVTRRGIAGVRFLGHVDGDARAAAFRAADIFLFPTSFAEGMPNAVLEAMAFGLPIVTRPVGGLRDFFEDGRMGYITSSEEPEEFASLVGRLAANPELRAAMGSHNREYARRRFAASTVAQRLLAVYGQVVPRRAVAAPPSRGPDQS